MGDHCKIIKNLDCHYIPQSTFMSGFPRSFHDLMAIMQSEIMRNKMDMYSVTASLVSRQTIAPQYSGAEAISNKEIGKKIIANNLQER